MLQVLLMIILVVEGIQNGLPAQRVLAPVEPQLQEARIQDAGAARAVPTRRQLRECGLYACNSEGYASHAHHKGMKCRSLCHPMGLRPSSGMEPRRP